MLAPADAVSYEQLGARARISREQPDGRNPEDLRRQVLVQGNPDERPIVLAECVGCAEALTADDDPRPPARRLGDA